MSIIHELIKKHGLLNRRKYFKRKYDLLSQEERLKRDKQNEINSYLRLEQRAMYDYNRAFYESIKHYKRLGEFYMNCRIAPLMCNYFNVYTLDDLYKGYVKKYAKYANSLFKYDEIYHIFKEKLNETHLKVFGDYVDREHILNPKQIWDNPLYLDCDREDRYTEGIEYIYNFEDLIERIKWGTFYDTGLSVLDFFYGIYHELLNAYGDRHKNLILSIKDNKVEKAIISHFKKIETEYIIPNENKESLKNLINNVVKHYLCHKTLPYKEQYSRLNCILHFIRAVYRINLEEEFRLKLP